MKSVVTGVVLLIAIGASPAAAAGPASEAAGKAARYLARMQNADGGFGGGRGQASSQLFTGWAALGLAAAGQNPREVKRRGGRALTSYLRRAGSINDTGELERTILVLHASGASPRHFGRRDLVSELARRQRNDGSWQGGVAATAFGVLALSAARPGAGTGGVASGAAYLERAQNDDGGLGLVPGGASEVDYTAAALQAMVAARRRDGGPATRATDYLRGSVNDDGGFGYRWGAASNSLSTAWAVQGLVAGGVKPGTVGANPIRYLMRLQRPDGHIAYSRSSEQSPVWATAQALPALRAKPFPLDPVRHRRRPPAHRTAPEQKAPSAAAEDATKPSRGVRTARPTRTPLKRRPSPPLSTPKRLLARRAGDSTHVPSREGGGPPVALAAAVVFVAFGVTLRLCVRRDT